LGGGVCGLPPTPQTPNPQSPIPNLRIGYIIIISVFNN
jgi:hypothetical protein